MATTPAQDRAFFGHPRGLSTLFFTEMWERFSYYGMRALLLLYMTAPLSAGGLGFDAAQGGAVYGLYTSMVYLATLPGGWIADRLIWSSSSSIRLFSSSRASARYNVPAFNEIAPPVLDSISWSTL